MGSGALEYGRDSPPSDRGDDYLTGVPGEASLNGFWLAHFLCVHGGGLDRMGQTLSALEVEEEETQRKPADPGDERRFDPDELDVFRRAFENCGDSGVGPDHFMKAYGEAMPSQAILRMFNTASAGAAHITSVPQWTRAFAQLCKPTPGCSSVKLTNKARVGVWFDLFKAAEATPSNDCMGMDRRHGESDGSVSGALDEASLMMLLMTALRQCTEVQCDVRQLEPIVRDALLLGPMSKPSWTRWALHCMPRLGDVLELLMMNGVSHLAGDERLTARASRLAAERWLPTLCAGDDVPPAEVAEGSPSRVITPALLWALTMTIPQPPNNPTTSWRLLFSSVEHGLSLNRFQHHVVGYAGPSLIVVRESPLSAGIDGDKESPAPALTWAAYVSEPWKCLPGGKWFGQEDCVVYTLHPLYHAHPATGHGANFVTFTAPVKAILSATRPSADVTEEVIGFGGKEGKHRAALKEGLTLSVFRHNDGTYEVSLPSPRLAARPAPKACLTLPCALLSHGRPQDDVERLKTSGLNLNDRAKRTAMVEVWGLGGTVAEAALSRLHEQAKRARAMAGKVCAPERPSLPGEGNPRPSPAPLPPR